MIGYVKILLAEQLVPAKKVEEIYGLFGFINDFHFKEKFYLYAAPTTFVYITVSHIFSYIFIVIFFTVLPSVVNKDFYCVM